MNYLRHPIADCRQLFQKFLIQKPLYEIAPELRPVPNPVSREYLLLVQQYSRLAFADSLEGLRTDSGLVWWKRVPACVLYYFRLKATTALIESLIVEHRLTHGSSERR